MTTENSMSSFSFFPDLNCCSISANVFPLVSGTTKSTKKNATAQKQEYIQNVPADVRRPCNVNKCIIIDRNKDKLMYRRGFE